MATRFEPGAPPAEGVVPLCVPEIRGNEWRYVRECLDTNWVSSVGPFVDRLEQAVAEYVGSRYAVATASGTAALHLALLVAGVRPQDEVLVSALTFIAPANAVRYAGAWPVFMDSEPDNWQMDPQKLGDFLHRECQWVRGGWHNRATHRHVKAIMPVHILGHPADMDPILEIARNHGLVVMEDATESLGGRYRQRMVGHLGDVACLSFNGNKVITAGGGGMIVTDDEGWARRARYLATQAKDDPVEYVHGEIGYNYRLTNIQAALAVAQMELLDEFVSIKRRNAIRYAESLGDVPGIQPMAEASWAFSTRWLHTVLVEPSEYGRDSRALLRWLGERGIQARPLWQPLHRSNAHVGSPSYRVEVADILHAKALSLPSSVGLPMQDLERVVDAVRSGSGAC